MERDFLGLGSKEEVVTSDGLKDPSVFMRNSAMQWPFSNGNKVSALPQLKPFKTVQDERSKRMALLSSGFPDVFDGNHQIFRGAVQTVQDERSKKMALLSSGFSEVSYGNHKMFSGAVQHDNITFDTQGGNHYAINPYPVQHVDPHSQHRSHEIRTYPVSNHTISLAMSNPYFKQHVATSAHNFVTNSMKQQPLGGVHISTPHSIVPGVTSTVGTSDQRNISKSTTGSAQLTIFYRGSVKVYDDVSPEKAEAIMFLAGNGASTNPNETTSRTQVQTMPPKTLGGDGAHRNQSYPSHCSGLSSPLSAHSGSGSSGTDDVVVVKPVGDLTAPISQPEPSKTVTLTAVPQARKASLARFLEKRKERVMNTMPYNMNKKSSEGSPTPGSNHISLLGSPEVGSFLVSKEQSWSLNKRIDERFQPTLGI